MILSRFALALFAASSLAACTAAPAPISVSPPVSTSPADVAAAERIEIRGNQVTLDGAVLEGTRALTLAGIALDSAQVLAIAAVRADLVRGPALDQLDRLNLQAADAVRAAYRIQDTAERGAAAVGILNIRNQIRALLPG